MWFIPKNPQAVNIFSAKMKKRVGFIFGFGSSGIPEVAEIVRLVAGRSDADLAEGIGIEGGRTLPVLLSGD